MSAVKMDNQPIGTNIGHSFSFPSVDGIEGEQATQAADARVGKEKHEHAITRGVMPMVMEREEGRRIVEEARKAEAEARVAKERAAAEARAANEGVAVEVRAAKERATAEARKAIAARTSKFEGPCTDCCVPLACCCVSAGGGKVYGCWPTDADYILPLCLHTCLCPQQGGNPCPTRKGDGVTDGYEACLENALAHPFLFCFQSGKTRYTRGRPGGDSGQPNEKRKLSPGIEPLPRSHPPMTPPRLLCSSLAPHLDVCAPTAVDLLLGTRVSGDLHRATRRTSGHEEWTSDRTPQVRRGRHNLTLSRTRQRHRRKGNGVCFGRILFPPQTRR